MPKSKVLTKRTHRNDRKKYHHQGFFDYAAKTQRNNRIAEIFKQNKVPILRTKEIGGRFSVEIPQWGVSRRGIDIDYIGNTEVVARILGLNPSPKVKTQVSSVGFLTVMNYRDHRGNPVFSIQRFTPKGKKQQIGIPSRTRSFVTFYPHPTAEIVAKAITERSISNVDSRTKEWLLRTKARANIARDVVESTPDIATHEMAWFKGRAGEMRPGAGRRERNEVSTLGMKSKDDHTFIHTHTVSNGKFLGRPSIMDIFEFLKDIHMGKIKNFPIFATDKKGKEVGRVIMHADRRFVEAVKKETPLEKELFNKIYSTAWFGVPENIRIEEFETEIKEQLMRMGVRFRYIPRPGYQWSHNQFVKKGTKTIEIDDNEALRKKNPA